MKLNISHFLTLCVIGVLSLSLASCGDDEQALAESPSYRDGVYSGSQLSVTLDGQELTDVSSVTLSSSMLNANVSQEKDSNQVAASNPTYTTTVKLVGFPTSGKTSTFTTVSNLTGFSGKAQIQGTDYNYEATFTGDPLLSHENQGLILKFTK